MKKTQTKNTTGLMLLSLALLFFGEGVFSAGLYWPVLFSLSYISSNIYWFAFLFGILVSLVTVTPFGLASLVLIGGLFLFGRIQLAVGNNFLFLVLIGSIFGFVTDIVLSLSWSFFEAVGSALVIFTLWRLNFFDNDLALRGGR